MGALCAGPNKKSQMFDATNVKLSKDGHANCDFKPTQIREIHEEYSVDGFENNMELFNKKWHEASTGDGFVNANCFKDMFYIVKKHAHLSILSDLQALIKKRRSLLHESENDEYAKVAHEIIELQREANQKHLHKALKLITSKKKLTEEDFNKMYHTCLADNTFVNKVLEDIHSARSKCLRPKGAPAPEPNWPLL